MVSNCGGLPGTSLGGVGFKLFINQDLSLTGKNSDLLWPCAYSDDRSPVVGAKYVNSGGFQDNIDEYFRFAEKNRCEYHLDGTKKPIMLYFKKKGNVDINWLDTLNVNNVLIEKVTKTKILGLTISTESSSLGSAKILKDHSYVLVPPIWKYSKMAYRFVNLRNNFIPEVLKRFVES